MHFTARTDGKEWCGQCERRQAAGAAQACRSQFCKLKALLPPEVTMGFTTKPQPISSPVDVHPALVKRVRAEHIPAGKRGARDADGLTRIARHVLNEMKRRGDKKTGEVVCSLNDLCMDIGCSSPATISPIMQTLIDQRMVSIIERRGGRAKTRYLIHGWPPLRRIGE